MTSKVTLMITLAGLLGAMAVPHGGGSTGSGGSGLTTTTTSVAAACSHPLAARLSPAPAAGGQLFVRLRQRCGSPAQAVARLCVTAPGGVAQCNSLRLPANRATRIVTVPTPRPGGWQITAQTPGSAVSFTRLSWVRTDGPKLTILAAGDSEMQLVDTDLAADLPDASIPNDARPSTGLENEWFFNWHHEAAVDVARYHAPVTMIVMGANGGFAINTAHGQVPCCGPAWSELYAQPTESLTRTFLDGNKGYVIWYLIPAASGAFGPIISGVDRGIQDAAAAFPGRVGIINASAFFTPGGRYRNYMTVNGQGLVIHESDGVHLSATADSIMASLGVQFLRAQHFIP